MLMPSVLVLLLAGAAPTQFEQNSRAAEQPVVLIVRMPPDAILELEGMRMHTMGDVRHFQIPPIETNREFNYSLRATWKEGDEPRELKRTIKVRGGQRIDVELYPDDNLTAEERTVLELVNKERAKIGTAPLKANAQLTRAARGHSANMARQNKLAHTLDGKTFSQRIDDTGYKYGEAGENCAQWTPTPAETMDMWMRSEGHRSNILNPHFKEIGIGAGLTTDGRKYWAQVFATPLEVDVP